MIDKSLIDIAFASLKLFLIISQMAFFESNLLI
jgi:hypothetical protein